MVFAKKEKLTYGLFKEKFFSEFPAFFLFTFLFSLVYALYKAFLFLINLDTLFLGITNSTTLFVIMLLFEIPFVYLFFVLSIYLLKRLFYKDLKVKDYFYLGLKLFIIDLLFVILISTFGILFLNNESVTLGILFIIITVLSLFFVFTSYKAVMKKTLLLSFANMFTQIANPKALAYFVLMLVIGIVLFLIALGLVYAQILPETIYALAYPCVLFIAFVFSYYAID